MTSYRKTSSWLTLMMGALAMLFPIGAWAQVGGLPGGSLRPVPSVPITQGPTPIRDCTTIFLRGSYVLVNNLPGSLGLNPNGGCLVIAASNVTLDLGGFSVIGTGAGSGMGHGIAMDGLDNVTIRNGTVRGFPAHGVAELSPSLGHGHRVGDLRVIDNEADGISLLGSDHQVRNCLASDNTDGGVAVGSESLVTGNTASGNGGHGISAGVGSIVTGNTASGSGLIGIRVGMDSTVADNVAHDNLGVGITADRGSTVTGNAVRNNDGAAGLLAGEGSTVTGNTASFNQFGIGITTSRGSTIMGNTAFRNAQNGIFLVGESLVSGNTAYLNDQSHSGFPNMGSCPTCTFGINHAP